MMSAAAIAGGIPLVLVFSVNLETETRALEFLFCFSQMSRINANVFVGSANPVKVKVLSTVANKITLFSIFFAF